MIWLELIWSMIQIGLFSIGGGYAALPLIQKQIVEIHGWLTLTEFADVVTIAEMTPGPIAINASTFVGIKVLGIPGGIVATLACVLPSCIIILILAKIYYRYRSVSTMQSILEGLRPAVVGMIASAGLSIFLLAVFAGQALPSSPEDVNLIALAIMVISFILLRIKKLSPIKVIIISGLIGLVVYGFILPPAT